MSNQPVSTTNVGERDIEQRIGTSPRIVASISVYVSQNGQHHINLGDKSIKSRSQKEVVTTVSKFLQDELDKDQFADKREE